MSQWLPVKDIAKKVNGRELSAKDLVAKSIQTIKDSQQYQAIIVLTEERALKRAEEIDNKVKDGKNAGRLAGVPFIAKDNFLVFGSDTTAASNILKGFEAPYQATAINHLEEEGAICVAKANMDAFGHGASTENSDFFVTKNPHDESRVPGGSSGGSAAAVVLDMAPFALGTDTGGSIRQPASLSGCVGYKPSYGLVSRSGVIAMASSTDCIGALANNVDDAALVLDVIAGPDELDSTTIERDKDYTDLKDDNKDFKVGVIKEYMGQGVDEGVKQTINEAITKLKQVGITVEEISIPDIDLGLAVYYILCPAEISSNLARYDGQRFGFSDQQVANLNDSYLNSRGKGFGKEAKRRIMIGTYVLSSGYYDAYYKKAQTVRTKLINDFNDAFSKYDYLIGPVSPTPAFKIGENIDNPLKMYLLDIMTVIASMVGIPAVSIPAGQTNGLPVGMQIMSAAKQDKSLLNIAKKIEGILK